MTRTTLGALRELLFFGMALSVSWWLFLMNPDDVSAPVEAEVEPRDTRVLPVAVLPEVVASSATVVAEAEPVQEDSQERPDEQASQAVSEAASVPEIAPAQEEGAPAPEPLAEGVEDEQASFEDGVPGGAEQGGESIDKVGEAGRSTSELERDPELAAAAHAELSGEVRRGFDTVLLAAPEEQLDIARAFGEELVLVPRRALDPAGKAHYFRLELDGAPRVERVGEAPPLELRRYRDLFDYEYARLPEGLRNLRRSVLARSEVYIFAALIPLSEWAVVVGRRREALDAAGLTADDVRRFDMRYVRTASGQFDLRVESIVLADGRTLSSRSLQSGKDIR